MSYVFPGSLILSTISCLLCWVIHYLVFGKLKKTILPIDIMHLVHFRRNKEFYDTQLDPEIRTISYNNYQIPSMLEYHLKPLKPSLSINGVIIILLFLNIGIKI